MATWPVEVARFAWGEMGDGGVGMGRLWVVIFVVLAICDGGECGFVFVFEYERLRVLVTWKLCSYVWARRDVR